MEHEGGRVCLLCSLYMAADSAEIEVKAVKFWRARERKLS